MARPRKASTPSKPRSNNAVTEKWAAFTWEDVDRWAGSRSASRGRTYQRQGRVANLTVTEDSKLLATVMGTDRYVTSVWLAPAKGRSLRRFRELCRRQPGANLMSWTFRYAGIRVRRSLIHRRNISTVLSFRRTTFAVLIPLLLSLLLFGEKRAGGEAAPRGDSGNIQNGRQVPGDVHTAQLDELIADLTSGALIRRVVAARKLGEMGDEAGSAVPHLIAAIRDPDPRFGMEAVVALGKIGVKAHGAIPLFRALVRDDRANKNLRVGAVIALGEFGPAAKQAIPDLMALLGDNEIDMRQQVAAALGKMGNDVIPLLARALKDENPRVSESAADALGYMGEDAVDPLIDALDDDRASVRAAAASAVGRIGPAATRAVSKLIELLDDEATYGPSVSVCSAVARALGDIGPPAAPAVPKLMTLAEKKNWNAVRALGKIGPSARAAVPLLTELVRERSYGIIAVEALGGIGPDAEPCVPVLVDVLKVAPAAGAEVARALGQIGSTKAVPLLLELLDSEMPEHQGGAIRALKELGPRAHAAVPRLRELALTAERPYTRHPLAGAATSALLVIEPDPSRFFVQGLRNQPETMFLAASALAQIGEPAMPAIIEALEGGDSTLCLAAIKVLHRMGPIAQQAVPALAGLTMHPSEDVSRASREFLWKLVHEQGLDSSVYTNAVVQALAHPERSVRSWAVVEVGRLGLGTETVVQRLLDLLVNDEQRYVRFQAVRTLGELGPKARSAVPVLRKVLRDVRDENMGSAAAAATALGNIGHDAEVAIPELIEVLGDGDGTLRRAAVRALGQLGPAAHEAIPALLEVRRRYYELTDSTAKALLLIGPEAIDALRGALKSDPVEVRVRTGGALGAMEAQADAAVPVLIDLLADEDPQVRRSAAWSLGAIGPAAKAALPALESASKDEAELVREAAARAIAAIRR